MAIIFRLAGYEKATERQVSLVDVPYWHHDRVKSMAGIHGIEDDQLGDWELDPKSATHIANLIPRNIDVHNCDYYLEPYLKND
jgi:hypothetical protein